MSEITERRRHTQPAEHKETPAIRRSRLGLYPRPLITAISTLRACQPQCRALSLDTAHHHSHNNAPLMRRSHFSACHYPRARPLPINVYLLILLSPYVSANAKVIHLEPPRRFSGSAPTQTLPLPRFHRTMAASQHGRRGRGWEG